MAGTSWRTATAVGVGFHSPRSVDTNGRQRPLHASRDPRRRNPRSQRRRLRARSGESRQRQCQLFQDGQRSPRTRGKPGRGASQVPAVHRPENPDRALSWGSGVADSNLSHPDHLIAGRFSAFTRALIRKDAVRHCLLRRSQSGCRCLRPISGTNRTKQSTPHISAYAAAASTTGTTSRYAPSSTLSITRTAGW